MHPLAQSLLRIAVADRHALLQQDRTRVDLGGDHVDGRARLVCVAAKSPLDGIHATREIWQQRRMHIDDPIRERVEKGPGVDSVVAGVDDQVDAMPDEEIAHRDVTGFGGLE